jgi:hypothetical protein
LIEKQIKSELYEVILGWLSAPNGRAGNGGSTVEQTATVSAWAMYGAAAQWSQKAKREPVDDFVGQVLPLITANLHPVLPTKSAKVLTRHAGGGSGAYALLRQFQLSYYN